MVSLHLLDGEGEGTKQTVKEKDAGLRGEFGAEAARSTSLVLSISAIGLVPVSLSYLLGRALHATRSMWTFAAVNLLLVAMNTVGCIMLSKHWGIGGIAASGTITFVLSTILLWALVRRKTGVTVGRGEMRLAAKVMIASTVMVCTALGFTYAAGQVGTTSPRFAIFASLVGWLIGVGGYLVCLSLLKVEEVGRGVALCVSWFRNLVPRSGN